MPQYAALLYTEDIDWSQPEHADMTKEYAAFGEAAGAAIKGGAALYPTATATTVRVNGGKAGDVVTTDGPYTETKEALTGFYLLEADDLEQAVRMASMIPAAWGPGGVEVRPVIPYM
jgi:hypothetical protein